MVVLKKKEIAGRKMKGAIDGEKGEDGCVEGEGD